MLKGLLVFGLTRRPIVLLCLLLFIGGGLIAFSKLNIEAYPNPAPVILEITAQAPGLSAEEMERYYTIPMEVGLAPTPGVDLIRSTSFYGLSFIRVVFKYGVDYYFAYTQAALSLQQRVNLPNNVQPTIQGSSLVGEIFRYQVVGPANFGLTNLRTVQDWILQRRLLTVEGVIQVVTWGGTTKEYEVEVDLHKLDAYNVTLPQVLAAIGNANSNVGGRTISFGEQSVNVRGLGLLDSGGADDLTQGYRVEDIENIVLAQSDGAPVQVKHVANVYVGYLPRLGKAGRDHQDDVVTSIVIMNRTLHTNDVLARVKAEVEKINRDRTLPPGVRIVPYYDRGTLVSVTTRTVLHNLVFGCLLVFFIQWLFLGDLRSAIIVGTNIPFALFFSVIILVLLGEDANLLSVGAVDFGIIVDSAVILVENMFRNFQTAPEQRQQLLEQLAQGRFGADPTRPADGASAWTDRLRLILASALQIDKAVFFSSTITVAAFVPLFTMQGVEGQIFNPMARTYGYALIGALIATFTITPVLASYLLPDHVREAETVAVRALRRVYTPVLRWSLSHRKSDAGQPRVDDGSENVEIDRLPDVIVRTELSPLELIFSAGLSGHEHKRHASEARGDVDQSLRYFESRHDRQIDIAQYEVGLFFQDCDKPFLTVVGSTRLETAVAEFFGDCRSSLAVGFDAQNFLLAGLCHAPPRMTSHRDAARHDIVIQEWSAMNCEKSP